MQLLVRALTVLVVSSIALKSAIAHNDHRRASGGNQACERFLESVWRDSPDSLDIVVKRRIVRQVRTVEEIRKKVEDGLRYHAKVTGNPFDQKLVEWTIKDTIQREGAQYSLARYRLIGDLQRVDIVEQNESTWGSEQGYTETRINGKRHLNGIVESIHYHHQRRTANLTADSFHPFWAYEDIWRIATVGPEMWSMLRAATGIPSTTLEIHHGVEVPEVVQDAAKMKSFLAGTAQMQIRMKVEKLGEVETDRFELVSNTGVILAAIHTSKGVPDQVLQVEIFQNGKPVQKTEASDYGPEGFPRTWRKTTYPSGKESETEELIIVSVVVNEPVADGLFEFQVPEGYTAATMQPDKLIVQDQAGNISEQPRLVPAPTAKPDSTRRILFFLNLAVLVSIAAYVIWKRMRSRTDARSIGKL